MARAAVAVPVIGGGRDGYGGGSEVSRRGEVPLLRCCRRGHATRMHLSQSRRAGELAPAAPPSNLPRAQAAWEVGKLLCFVCESGNKFGWRWQ